MTNLITPTDVRIFTFFGIAKSYFLPSRDPSQLSAVPETSVHKPSVGPRPVPTYEEQKQDKVNFTICAVPFFNLLTFWQSRY